MRTFHSMRVSLLFRCKNGSHNQHVTRGMKHNVTKTLIHTQSPSCLKLFMVVCYLLLCVVQTLT